jgi:small-conductance mechanosensitive channel
LISHELYMDIYKTMVREGIEIPFPQREVWIRAVPNALAGEKEGDPG